MANIAISDLGPVGANLFLDSESFLNDITNEEMTNLLGGIFISIVWADKHYGFEVG